MRDASLRTGSKIFQTIGLLAHHSPGLGPRSYPGPVATIGCIVLPGTLSLADSQFWIFRQSLLHVSSLSLSLSLYWLSSKIKKKAYWI